MRLLIFPRDSLPRDGCDATTAPQYSITKIAPDSRLKRLLSYHYKGRLQWTLKSLVIRASARLIIQESSAQIPLQPIDEPTRQCYLHLAREYRKQFTVQRSISPKFDTPHGLKPDGFSVLRRSQRHASPKGLPGPLYILGSVVVSMQAGSAVWTRVPADGQALRDDDATARTRLAGVRRIDRNH